MSLHIELTDDGLLAPLLEARHLYSAMDFTGARSFRDTYIHGNRPKILSWLTDELDADNRVPCRISFIVVAYRTGKGLLDCVKSILGQCQNVDAEVLVVDNGGNEDSCEELLSLGVTIVKLPCNIGPCEARNIGAFASRGRLLAFIDDDAILASGCVDGIVAAFDSFTFSAIRGRILPLDNAASALPGHYDLGQYPIPSILETEGAMVIRRDVWEKVGGMDPMLFGAEGAELTERIFKAFPQSDIYYWPSFAICHDYAVGACVECKLERHRVAREYFSRYGKAARELSQQYGLWYQARPATSIRYDQRTLLQKVKAAVTEMVLRKKASPKLAENKHVAITSSQLALHAYGKEMLIQRLLETERRAKLLEQNLESITASSAYRLVRILVEGYKSPLQTLKQLPSDVAAVVRNITVGNGGKAPSVVLIGESQAAYTQPGREEHRCKIFPPSSVTVKPKVDGVRLGSIVPAGMFSSLMYDCVCEAPDSDSLEQWFDTFQPNLVLGAPVYDGRGRLQQALFDEAKRRGIPSAFWYTQGESAFNDFKSILNAADKCYVAAEGVASCFADVRECGILPPAVQPALHNPLTLQSDIHYEVGNTICFDGWADFIEYQEHWNSLLSSLNSQAVHIFESRWSFMANKLNDIPEWKRMIHGCVTPEQLRTIFKYYPVVVQGDKTLSGTFSRASAALSAISSGAAVVANEKANLFSSLNLPEQMYFSASTADTFRDTIASVLILPERDKKSQKARREIYDKHTYAHRLGQICADLSVHYSSRTTPLCTLITPTKRPHLLEECLKRHHSQTYDSIESIVVLNNTECDVEAVRRLCERSGSTLIVMSEEYTIGQCLNEAIRRAKGELWFKIDDDDYYGANYVKDTVHSWNMSQADLFGKPPGYIYFAGDDSLWRRDVSKTRPHYICNTNWPHMSGATFAGSKKNGAALAFPSMHRACVDSLFFEQTLRDGHLMHMTDHYSFVAYRAADKTQHTWRQQDSELQRNAEKIGDGSAISDIIV